MQQKRFFQKIVYLLALCVLLFVLYVVGRPAKVVVPPGGDSRLDPGGILAKTRDSEGLTESKIGEIDPASSTVKLATFGLRGVAIAMLWHRSQEFQKRHDWNNVIATSNQLVFLEPHFTTIWEFLGWNLSYNASAEYDDYRERYRWVIRGIDFLIRGVEYNRQAPKLCKATGWTISQKIGIADEKEQYRRLLREDDEFWLRHDKLKLPSERDNWILGRRWYLQGEELIKAGHSVGNESHFLYFSNSRLNLFNYAMWKRMEGIFGEEAIRAWENAGAAWNEFSKMELSTAIPKDGKLRMTPGAEPHMARLETTDIVNDRKKEITAELYSLVSGLREELCLARWKELGETPGQQGTILERLEKVFEPKRKDDETDYTDYIIIRNWLDKNEPDWKARLKKELDALYTPEQLELKKIPSMFLDEEQRDIVTKADNEVGQIRGRSMELLQVGPKVFAQEIQETNAEQASKQRARDIVEEIDGFKQETRYSDLYRGILNYEFRVREVDVECAQEVDDARRKRYFARKAYYDARVQDSITGWLDAMQSWEDLLNKPGFEDVQGNVQFVRDIIDIVEKFVIILDNDNKIFSDVAKDDKFPLQGLIRSKISHENSPYVYVDALKYAKAEYEKGEYGKTEEYFMKLCQSFEGVHAGNEYMKLAPLPDLRDAALESNAYYIRTLQKQNKPLPDHVPLRSFVELMIEHDPKIDQAVAAMDQGRALLQENKPAEAEKELEKTISLWKPILERYPIIPLDPTHRTYGDLRVLAGLYVQALNAQEKKVPEDFLLKDFLR